MKGQAISLLKMLGATKVRHGKHTIWKLPNGAVITQSHTSSDHRSERNLISNIKHAAGLITSKKEPTQTEPKQKKVKPEPQNKPVLLKPLANSKERTDLQFKITCAIDNGFEHLMKAEGVKPAKWRD